MSHGLFLQEADLLQRKKEQLEMELYNNVTFAPSIDPLSKALGRATGFISVASFNVDLFR